MPKENSESPGKCWEDRNTVVAVCGVTHSKPSLSCDLEIGWKLAETVGTEPDTVRGAVSGRGSVPLHPGCEPDRCASAPRVRRMSTTSPFNHQHRRRQTVPALRPNGEGPCRTPPPRPENGDNSSRALPRRPLPTHTLCRPKPEHA